MASSSWITQAEWQGHLLLGWNTHTARSETMGPSWQMMPFWCREKSYPSWGPKSCLLWMCIVFERHCLVHVLSSVLPCYVLNAHIMCQHHQFQGLATHSVPLLQHRHLHSEHWSSGGNSLKIRHIMLTKSTLENACLLVEYPRSPHHFWYCVWLGGSGARWLVGWSWRLNPASSHWTTSLTFLVFTFYFETVSL